MNFASDKGQGQPSHQDGCFQINYIIRPTILLTSYCGLPAHLRTPHPWEIPHSDAWMAQVCSQPWQPLWSPGI